MKIARYALLVALTTAIALACTRPEPQRSHVDGTYVPPATFIAAPGSPVEGSLLQYHSGTWQPLNATDGGLALISGSGGAAPSFGLLNLTTSVSNTLPAGNGGGGWVTILDLNFATQTTQTLTSDGAYTLGGVTWTKSNTAHEASAMVITNGTGLVITPGASSSYIATATRTAPILTASLSNIKANTISGTTPLRLWVDFHAVTGFSCTASNVAQYYCAGFECNPGSGNASAVIVCKANTVSGCVWESWTYSDGTQIGNSLATTNYSGRPAALVTLPSGIWSPNPVVVGTGSYTTGFLPDYQMQAESMISGAGGSAANIAPNGLPGGCNVFVSGGNSNASVISTTGTIDEIRLDYHP